MTDPPKLYPGHQHQWTDADPQLFTNSLVRCVICDLEMPRNAAGLDGRIRPPQRFPDEIDQISWPPVPEQETRDDA